VRLSGLLGAADLDRLEDRFPGVDLAAVVVRLIPGQARAFLPSLQAIAIGRTIWMREPTDRSRLPALMAHELTHVGQWRQQGPLGFLTRYLSDYLRARLRGLGHAAAYRQIPAEEEARAAARGFTPD
jgi:hypothetical protein